MDAKEAFETLLSPASVAVIGASADPAAPGGAMFENLQRLAVPVWPVHPTLERISDTPCYASLAALPSPPELAVIATRADRVPRVLSECAQAGVKVGLSIAGGFAEVGTDGEKLERELTNIVSSTGIRLLGPNTLGVVAPHAGLDTIFVRHEMSVFAAEGDICLITQSGSVGVEALGMLANSGQGIRSFLGLGNQIDLDVVDALHYVATDAGTKVTALYLESIPDGRALMDAIGANDRPVVVLKVGRTDRGSKAAASHTGRLAGAHEITRGALIQAGAVLARDDEQLLDIARALAFCPPTGGRNVAVVSAAGGYAVLGTDLVLEAGLDVATFSDATRGSLAEVVPPYGSVDNPIDMTGMAHDDMYQHVVETLIEAPEVDAMLCFLSWGPHGLTPCTIDTLARAAGETDKPIVVHAMGGPDTDELVAQFTKRRVAAYPSMHRSVAALAGLAQWGRHRNHDA